MAELQGYRETVVDVQDGRKSPNEIDELLDDIADEMAAFEEEIDMLQEEIQGELGDELEEMAELLETENLHLKPVQVEELKKIVEIAEIPCDELSDILINQSDGLLPCIKKADGDRVALLEISGTTRKCTKKQKRAKKARKARKAKKMRKSRRSRKGKSRGAKKKFRRAGMPAFLQREDMVCPDDSTTSQPNVEVVSILSEMVALVQEFMGYERDLGHIAEWTADYEVQVENEADQGVVLRGLGL